MVVIDLTITPIQFTKDGKIYNITEVMTNGKTGLLISAEQVVPAEQEFNEIIEI